MLILSMANIMRVNISVDICNKVISLCIILCQIFWGFQNSLKKSLAPYDNNVWAQARCRLIMRCLLLSMCQYVGWYIDFQVSRSRTNPVLICQRNGYKCFTNISCYFKSYVIQFMCIFTYRWLWWNKYNNETEDKISSKFRSNLSFIQETYKCTSYIKHANTKNIQAT